MSDNPEDYELVHYGVKGMKWGVRKDREVGSKRALAKKVAIGTGALVGAVGLALTTQYLRDHGDTKVDSIPKTEERLPDLEELFMVSRGKTRGYTVMKDGAHPKPMTLMREVFGEDLDNFDGNSEGTFYDSPYGKGYSMNDPKGRQDQSGRPIYQSIIIPNSMKDRINTKEDVMRDVWPVVEEYYDYT